MSEKLLARHVEHLEDVIAAKDCDIERMRKRIAKLVRQRDEANELAGALRVERDEAREAYEIVKTATDRLLLSIQTKYGEA